MKKQVSAFLPNSKAFEVLTIEERQQYFNSLFSAKTGELTTVPQDIAKKLRIETDRINKDKKITFRVTTDVYEKVEAIANANDLSMSRLMEIITKEHLQILNTEYALASFINTFAEDELKNSLIDSESKLPEEFKLYTKVMKKYPDAPPVEGPQKVMSKMQKINNSDNVDNSEDETGGLDEQ